MTDLSGPPPALSGPPPAFSGPLPADGIVEPACIVPFDLAANGYLEQEFLVSGTARSYALAGPASGDGQWAAEVAGTAPFRTRVVVRRPDGNARFSGTLLVEWLNVSSGFEADADWAYTHEEILRAGHAWAGVSAQAVGVAGGESLLSFPGVAATGLRGANPARYATLEHPGDQYALDIFRQIGQALGGAAGPAQAPGEGAAGPAPVLGGLTPRRVLAIGESQSAFYLVSYINAVHPLSPFFDGFLVHSRGGGAAPLDGTGIARDAVSEGIKIRSDNEAPVLTVQTESDLAEPLAFGKARQPDTGRLRIWEVAGASHADAYLIGPGATLLGLDWRINEGPHRFVAQAALHALNRWISDGVPPPSAPGIELKSVTPAVIARDPRGIVLGGIRTPMVDVPAVVLSGEGPKGPPGGVSELLGWLVGSTTPIGPAELRAMYGGKEGYLAAYTRSLDAAIAAGFVLPAHRAELLAQADAVEFAAN
jgi:hypothetical protein